jgi:hypothetical protein
MKVFDLNDVACEGLGLSCLQKEWNYACDHPPPTCTNTDLMISFL